MAGMRMPLCQCHGRIGPQTAAAASGHGNTVVTGNARHFGPTGVAVEVPFQNI